MDQNNDDDSDDDDDDDFAEPVISRTKPHPRCLSISMPSWPLRLPTFHPVLPRKQQPL